MKKGWKRKIALFMAAIITAGSLNTGTLTVRAMEAETPAEEPVLQLTAEEETVSDAYKIYPIPQSIVYGEGVFTPSATVNVVGESKVDEATWKYLEEVLKKYNIAYQKSDEIAAGGPNILLGIKGSGEKVEEYVTTGNGAITVATENFWTNHDAHVVKVTADTIVIYGSDSDSVFHGVSTLKMMCSSFEELKFPAVQIEDFAVVESRGYIEGFYGSWNHEARKDLMRFAKDYKMNSYVYAAKSDTLHTNRWYEKYPEDMMEQFRELVAVGEETKVRFAWSVHTGSFFANMNIPSDEEMAAEGYESNTEFDLYRTRYQQLMEKFNQLIEIGVKRFDILNDDFGSGDIHEVVLVLNRINQDLKDKGCESITYCPQGYNKGWALGGYGKYGQELDSFSNLDEDIKIYWTGDDVNKPITQDTVDFVTTRSHGHKPDFWLNYPVNEHAKSGIFLGHIRHYARNDVTGLAGFHSNPCRYPYASQVGLYQLAALVWNNHEFEENAEIIWASAFDYLQPEVKDAYFKIANHISNAPNSSRVGDAFPESDAIAQLLTTVLAELKEQQGIAQSTNVQNLKKEFEDILAAIEEFRTNCATPGLVTDLDPWLKSLKDLATAGRDVLEAAIAIEEDNLSRAWEKLSSASTAYSTCYTYRANSDDPNIAKAGSKRIDPFVVSAIDYVTNALTPALNPDNAKVVPTLFAKLGGVERANDANGKKMYDGDVNTVAIWNVEQEQGDYIGLDLGREIKVTDITIVQGNDDDDHDILHTARLEYSVDNQNWNTIDSAVVTLEGHLITAENLNINARYVRYYLTETGYGGKPDYWTHIREFTVNKPVPTGDRVYTNVEALKETPLTIEGTGIGLRGIDEITLEQNQYVGIKLKYPANAYSITTELSNAVGLTVEYSYNEEQWFQVEETTENVALKYLRVINKTNTAVATSIEKLEASLQVLQTEPKLLTADMNGGIKTGTYALAVDGDRSTFVETGNNQVANNYITFDLGKNIEVHDVTLVTTDGSETFSKAQVQISLDNSSWNTIGTINNNMNFPEPPYKFFECSGAGEQARYLRILITENKNSTLKLHEIEINRQVEGGNQAEEVTSTATGNTRAVIDNNIATAMVIDAEAGDSLEYRISENTNITKVNIMTGGAGEGMVYVVKADGQEVLLGSLDKSVSEFDTSPHVPIIAIRLKWEQPEKVSVHEILLVRGVYNGTDIGVYVEPMNSGGTQIRNLAQGKTVTVSGTTDGNKDHVVDNNTGTKWDSNVVAKTEEGTETAWIQIDLGEAEAYEINRLVISYHNLIYPTSYTVEVSEDGAQWKQIGGVHGREASNSVTYPVDTIEFDEFVKARYVKLNFSKLNSHAAGRGVGITEFEIYGRPYQQKEAISEKLLLSENCTVEISGAENNTTEKKSFINDGAELGTDADQRWDSNYIQKGDLRPGETAWFSMDLGETPVLIDEFYIRFYKKVYPTDYLIQVSNDNNTWYTLRELTKEAAGAQHPTDTITLETPVHARYVRWFFKELNTDAAGNGIGVTEAKVFGRKINEAADVVAVEAVEDIHIKKGQQLTAELLPAFNKTSVRINTLEDVLQVEVPVRFTQLQGENSTITGDLQLSGITNTTNKQVEVEVIVEEDEALLAYFDFDQDLTNKTGKEATGEIVGEGVVRTDINGISGGALEFKKMQNSYFNVGNIMDASAKDYTLSAWVKYEDGYSDGVNEVMIFQQGGEGKSLLFLNSSSQYGTLITGVDSKGTEAVNTAKWHMVTMTWDESEQEITVYVNGEVYYTQKLEGSPTEAVTDLYVGAHKDGTVGNALKGFVDEVRIYDRVLEASIIEGLFKEYEDSDLLKDPPIKLTVKPDSEVRTFSEAMFGINHRYHNNGYGTWNVTDWKIEDEFHNYVKEAGFGSVRYPGGTVSNLFEWKRSIGPAEDRKATVNGSTFFDSVGQAPVEPNFGIDEAMTWIRDDLGAEAIYVYGMKGSAADAADLIEYLNAPADGDLTNPNDGIDWAEIRKENGHEEPYNVTTFEIGNEVGQGGQTYWLDGRGSRNAVEAFINGGEMTFNNTNKTVKEEDWRTAAANSDGTANQVRYTYYAPLVEGSVSVMVGNTPFSVVETLEGAGEQNVCTVDYETGKITFGDGTNGNIPENGQQIKAGYKTMQDGFLAISKAMKDTAEEIGIEIKILAGIEDKNGFVDKMNELNANDQYDGIAIHPYSNNPSDIPANDALFYEKMLGRTLQNNVTRVENLRNKMKETTGEDKITGVSEFGIFRYTNPFIKSLGHAIYIANEMIYYVELGAEYLNKHCLVDFVSGTGAGADSLGPVGQCVIQAVPQEDGSYRFVSTPSAKMFSIFNNMSGTILLENEEEGNTPFYDYNGHQVPKANFMSTMDEEGNLYVIAVNNERKENDITVMVEGMNLTGVPVEVWYLTAEDVLAENSLEAPSFVDVIKETQVAQEEGITYTLSPNSVTAFKVSSGTAVRDHLVHFVDEQGEPLLESKTVSGNQLLTDVETPRKEGYAFLGWYTNEGKFDIENTPVTNKLTLTGKWLYVGEVKEEDHNSLIQELEKENQEVIQVSDKVWAVGVKDLTYTGKKQTQQLRVYDGTKLLKEKTDYTISYKNNLNAYTLERDGNQGEYTDKAPYVKITMKGNYKGAKEVNFQILPVDIGEDAKAVAADDLYFDVNTKKKEQILKPQVVVNGKKLKLGKDFILSREKADITTVTGDNPYEVIITGSGNYTGTRSINVVVGEKGKDIFLSKAKAAVTIGSKTVAKPKVQWKEDGYEFAPEDIVVTYKGQKLTVDKDFMIKEYIDNDKVGTATLILEGLGSQEALEGGTYRFHGQKRLTFTITGTDMKTIQVMIPEEKKKSGYFFRGEPVCLLEEEGVKVTLADKSTEVSSDAYTVAYTNNVNKGTATAILTGNPEKGFSKTKKVTYKIAAAPITKENISFAAEEAVAPIMKGGAKPEMVVVVDGRTLKEGIDYTVSYGKNKKVTNGEAQATAKVKGKGNYTKGDTLTFAIEPKRIDSPGITVAAKDKVLKKDKWQQTFKVYDADGKALKAGTDYEKTAVYKLVDENGTESDIKETPKAGDTIKIYVKGLNSYGLGSEDGATVSTTYRLMDSDRDISKAKLKIYEQSYHYKTVTVEATSEYFDSSVKLNGYDLFDENGNAYFEIVEGSYKNNHKKGTAKVTVRGLAPFAGERVVTFKITQRDVEQQENWWSAFLEGIFHF